MSRSTLTDEARAETLTPTDERRRRAQSMFGQSPVALLFKIVLLGLLDAGAIYAIMALAAAHSWIPLAVVAIGTLILNIIYLPPNRMLPGKYLAPGLVFLLVFQVFVLLFSLYIAFTNYGDAHMGAKSDAIAAIQRNNQDRVEGSPAYPLTVLDKAGSMAMAVVDPDSHEVKVGDNGKKLEVRTDAQVDGDRVTAVPGYTVLTLADLFQRQPELAALACDLTDDTADGTLRTQDGATAYVYKSRYAYDKAADTFTATDGKVFRAKDGSYTADDGSRLDPGWMVPVGFDNFKRAVSDESIRGPFLKVTAWTFAFALLSVLLSFVVGLFFAVIFNDARVKGRRVIRTLLLLPYAFPAFLSALVWSGLMNPTYGYINNVILRNPGVVDWLGDPTWAKISILMVNTWLGYPYMFLVCTGALQSIPDEVLEASRMDGASWWQTFREIKLPLLMVPLAPLLVSSFAYNFNNFALIYLLTGGGPRFSPSNTLGHTDVLITMVYKIANDTAPNYGLASAFAILIFIVVGLLSWVGFRQTRALEDIN